MYSLLSLLIKRFDTLNDDEKQAVNLMLYTSPKLASAHALKEAFFAALKSKTRLEALSALTTWIIQAENSNLPYAKAPNIKGVINISS